MLHVKDCTLAGAEVTLLFLGFFVLVEYSSHVWCFFMQQQDLPSFSRGFSPVSFVPSSILSQHTHSLISVLLMHVFCFSLGNRVFSFPQAEWSEVMRGFFCFLCFPSSDEIFITLQCSSCSCHGISPLLAYFTLISFLFIYWSHRDRKCGKVQMNACNARLCVENLILVF